MYTIREHFGSLEGLNIAIVGDILHSRVVRSNIIGMKKLGANITVCGPKTLIPTGLAEMGVNVSYNLEETLGWARAVMMLRIQLERQESGLFPSLREYHERYGLKMRHLEKFPDFIILHPGPINRGVEMESDVADSGRSVILDQVTNGLAVRMAVLYLLSGGLRV
jgi:aspartate carbamoyltransferase catalytic subunit